MIKFLDLYKQYEEIRTEVDQAIAAVIKETAFIGGKYARKFEEDFAAFLGIKCCVAVGNGTDAIEIGLEALGLPPGSEVIIPANSFIASSEAVTRAGHKAVFCDADLETYTLSVKDAEARISPRTRAIIPVHLYGHPCDMDAVMALAKKHGLRVVEDCAQAHGAEFKGRKVGTFGDVATFSFYPGKNLGAYGDGGAIVCNDETLAKRCRMIANHGRIAKYDHEFEGRNSRLDGIQGAILSVKLKHLPAWNDRRRELAGIYLKELSRVTELTLPKPASWASPVWHLFVVRTSRRDELQEFLKGKGVETGVHYPIALPCLKAYQSCSAEMKALPVNAVACQLLSLPMGDSLTPEEIRKVSETMCGFFRK